MTRPRRTKLAPMTPGARAPRTAALATALGCWAVAIVLLLLLPVLVAADGGSSVTGSLAPTAVLVGSGPWWAVAVTLTFQCAALLRVHHHPRASVLVIAGLALVLAVLAPGTAYTLSHLPVLVAVFVAAPRRPWRAMRPVLAAAALAVTIGMLLNALRSGLSTVPGALVEALVQGVGVVGITALISLALASIRTAREAQRKEVAALAREREAMDRARAAAERERDAVVRERGALTRAVLSEERAAMARELHDIAAHHLSGITLVAAAADRQIDTDPGAAHESVRQVRSQTRAVLEDIRRVVGLLRSGGPAERTVESLATVPELVTDRAATGLPVRFERRARADGDREAQGIGPLAQLVVYRMVQEALTNASVHAPGAPCLVTVDDSDDAALAISVRNERPDVHVLSEPSERTGGFGLLGMRERAELIGGRLVSGPSADGGWLVELRIPRDTVGAPAQVDAGSTIADAAEEARP